MIQSFSFDYLTEAESKKYELERLDGDNDDDSSGKNIRR